MVQAKVGPKVVLRSCLCFAGHLYEHVVLSHQEELRKLAFDTSVPVQLTKLPCQVYACHKSFFQV